MSSLDGLRGIDLSARRTGAEYLRLYGQLKAVAEQEDNGPLDVLRRGGEVSLSVGSVYGGGAERKEHFGLSYQRPDVIARESLILHAATSEAEDYEARRLEFGHEGELLKVTHSADFTRDQFGDELKAVLYVDPESATVFRAQ